jgi:GNAT superfamily N-acetyltransferase
VETDAFIAEAVRAWADPTGPRRVWAADSRELGVLGIGEIKRITGSCVEIAYAVHVDHWGRGLGSEIARLLLGLAFDDPATERARRPAIPATGVGGRAAPGGHDRRRHTAPHDPAARRLA